MAEPITLSAALGYDFDAPHEQGKSLPRVVMVFFGDTEIISLPPVRESRAGHGDDSSYFAQEEQTIIEETVAPLLRRLFCAAHNGKISA